VRAQQLGASAIGLGREGGGKSIWAQPSRGAAATAPRTPILGRYFEPDPFRVLEG
jgi:hypothetical protein